MKYSTKKMWPALSRRIRGHLHQHLHYEKGKKVHNQAPIRKVIDLLKKSRDLTDDDLPIVREALKHATKTATEFEDWIRQLSVADTFSKLGD